MDLSTAEIKDTAALQEVVAKLCAAIAGLPVGEAIMVPGGWDGNVGTSTVVHLVERTAASGLNGARFLCLLGRQGMGRSITAHTDRSHSIGLTNACFHPNRQTRAGRLPS